MDACGVRIAECACSIDKDRCDGRHLCNEGNCGGSWQGEAGQTGEPLLIPSGLGWKEHVALTNELIELGPEMARLKMILLGML